MDFLDKLKQNIKIHALEENPYECCGFVLKSGDIIKCKNLSHNPKHTFLVDTDGVNTESPEIAGYYHSHPTQDESPSELDKTNAEQTLKDSYIYSILTDGLGIYKPNGYKLNIEKRPFCYGISDCWTLARDYYEKECRINMEIGPMRTSEKDVLSGNMIENVLIPIVEKNGFKEIEKDKPKKHDLLLMKLRGTVLNHAAVYVDDNIVLHSLANRGYCRHFYGDYLKKRTCRVFRHSSYV